MKNPQAHLSDEVAQKQLKQFLIAAWSIAVVSFFIFGWAAIASLAFGGRCIVLSWHRGNAESPSGAVLKWASITVTVISFLELLLFQINT